MLEHERNYPTERQPFETAALEPEFSGRLETLALGLPAGIYAKSFQKRGDFLEAAEKLTEEMEASSIGQALRNLKEGNTVALTITGVPRDRELPQAPLDGRAPQDKKTFVSEGFACAIAFSLGQPTLMVGEKDGDLVHQITPVPGREVTQSNEGSVELKMHQDLAPNPEATKVPYGALMPDYLILTGVQRGSGHTPTYISSLDAALQRLNQETIDVLGQQLFITDPPESFIKGGVSPDDSQLPTHKILSLHKGHYESCFDTGSNVRPIKPGDAKAAQAIAELNAAMAAVKQEVVIEPGTAVIFNNRRVTHGRGPLEKGQADTGKRWIQRVYVVDTRRFMDEALKSGLKKVQMAPGLLRATALSAPDMPDAYKEMFE